MVEDYWSALTRDVPYSQYSSDPTIAQACADLSKLSDYRGPNVNGQITPDVIFRGLSPGETTGPLVSQFLWKTIPFGAAQLPQLYRTTVAGDDYMTTYPAWLNVQKGVAAGSNVFDSTPRYIRNNRDLSEYLHRDFMGQANVLATLLLLSYGAPALNPNNPYLNYSTQAGSITFGHKPRWTCIGALPSMPCMPYGGRSGWSIAGFARKRSAAEFIIKSPEQLNIPSIPMCSTRPLYRRPSRLVATISCRCLIRKDPRCTRPIPRLMLS